MRALSPGGNGPHGTAGKRIGRMASTVRRLRTLEELWNLSKVRMPPYVVWKEGFMIHTLFYVGFIRWDEDSQDSKSVMLRWVEIRKSTKGERWEGRHSCSGEAARHLEISTSDGSSTCFNTGDFFWGCLWKLELGSTLQGGTKPETTLEPLPKLLKTMLFFFWSFEATGCGSFSRGALVNGESNVEFSFET